jgi:hypothetical protein
MGFKENVMQIILRNTVLALFITLAIGIVPAAIAQTSSAPTRTSVLRRVADRRFSTRPTA